MKPPKTPKNKAAQGQRVTAATLADLTDYSPSTITAWTQDGTLKRGKDGLFDRLEAMQAIAAHEESRDNDGNGASGRGEIAKLRAELLRERIKAAKHENAVAAGLFHLKDDCVQSMIEIRARESRVLHQLPAAMKTAWPELPEPVISWVSDRINETIERLKG